REKRGRFNVDAGLLGTKTILNALSENGNADLAYRLASSTEEPSWGYWIAHGATTLYENWPIDAHSDISMNHIMFGEIGAWMYKALGGIRPDPTMPGFKRILLEPHIIPQVAPFSCMHDCPYGRIESSWANANGHWTYKVTIPPGAEAILKLPGTPEQVL